MNRLGVLLIGAIILCFAQIVYAQGELVLSINRDLGYGGFDNRIEGLFSLEAKGPEDLARVDFYIDDQWISSIEQTPFRVQFSTESYAPGAHRLHATGFTVSNEQLQSNEIVRVFITKEESRNAVFDLVLPLLGMVLVILFASAALQLFLGRRQKAGNYGILGGAVCPNCGLPFSLRLFGINMIAGKLQRCPHCGKWSVVRRASPEELAAAEARWRGEDQAQIPVESREQRTRRQIDDSRYEK